MAEFLAYRILIGKLTLEKVPAKLREAVKTILEDSGYYDVN